MTTTATFVEHPILFRGELVRAILAGSKTQTRRLVTPPVPLACRNPVPILGTNVWSFWHPSENGEGRKCPFGVAGDRLWVRETFWCEHDSDGDDYSSWDCGVNLREDSRSRVDYCATPECLSPPRCKDQQTVIPYKGKPTPGDWWLAPPDDWKMPPVPADGGPVDMTEADADHERRGQWEFLPWGFFGKYPSIHMPRWASRLLLEVTDVRLQRLQDMGNEDALAEGVPADVSVLKDRTPREFFGGTWDSHNAADWQKWNANPWVWALSFRVAKVGRPD